MVDIEYTLKAMEKIKPVAKVSIKLSWTGQCMELHWNWFQPFNGGKLSHHLALPIPFTRFHYVDEEWRDVVIETMALAKRKINQIEDTAHGSQDDLPPEC